MRERMYMMKMDARAEIPMVISPFLGPAPRRGAWRNNAFGPFNPYHRHRDGHSYGKKKEHYSYYYNYNMDPGRIMLNHDHEGVLTFGDLTLRLMDSHYETRDFLTSFMRCVGGKPSTSYRCVARGTQHQRFETYRVPLQGTVDDIPYKLSWGGEGGCDATMGEYLVVHIQNGRVDRHSVRKSGRNHAQPYHVRQWKKHCRKPQRKKTRRELRRACRDF